MKTIKCSLVLLTLVVALASCDHNNVPVWPEEYVYDTIDCSKWNIPAGAITVREALRIGKELGSGGVSDQTYMVKGIITGFHADHQKAMKGDYKNGMFYIQDNLDVNASFYCYHTLGLNNTKFTSLDQLQIGDFVVVQCKINNYSGTIETHGSSGSYLVFSTNDLVYPAQDVKHYTETFADGLGAWTQQAMTDPGFAVWSHNATQSGITSAIANGNGAASEVWLVSPSIDLSQASTQPIKLTFQTYYTGKKDGYNVKDYLRMKVRKDNGNWADMEIPNFNAGIRAQQYVNDTLDITDFVSANTQIAFSYKSTTDFAPTWSVNNITIVEHKHMR